MMPEGRLEKPSRIDALDVLRGLAILGMFYINIPIMGSPSSFSLRGSDGIDQATNQTLDLLIQGTQRGMLSLVFGASMILLTTRTMKPDGRIRITVNYFRRNLWLLAFGLVHIIVLLWPYDILHVYAIAALFLFPLRKIGPKTAMILGLAFAIFVLITDNIDLPWTTISYGDLQNISEYRQLCAGGYGIPPRPNEARLEDYPAYVHCSTKLWFLEAGGTSLLRNVAEAFSTMLIGVALFKWGFIQGLKSRRFYLAITIAAYAVGLPLRWSIMHIFSEGLPLDASEFARLAITIGHVGLVNLLLQSKFGKFLLTPFKAAGRTALSLYLMQTIIAMFVLFPPWGFGLWGEFGLAGLAVIASIVVIVQVICANLWLRAFSIGPLEWVWRSLSAWQSQPFHRRSIRSDVG